MDRSLTTALTTPKPTRIPTTMCGGGSVHDARRDRLAVLMAGLAQGDLQALFAFHAEFGTTLAGVLRRELARLGRHEVPPEDLDGLVLDACMELAEIAGSWRAERARHPGPGRQPA